jgi:hypothetical protein
LAGVRCELGVDGMSLVVLEAACCDKAVAPQAIITKPKSDKIIFAGYFTNNIRP